MVAIYVDECKESAFLLVGVCVEDLDKLPLKGQRSIHFKHESSRRKRIYVTEFLRLGFTAAVFRVKGVRGIQARGLSLKKLVAFARGNRINQIVLELDESAREHDERLLSNSVKLIQGKREMQWEHRQRHQEPLLWVADAVAWCLNRGGEWERMVRPMIVQTFDC